MTATLNKPYKGYRNIELIEKSNCKWRAKVLGSGLEVEVYEDEFTKD